MAPRKPKSKQQQSPNQLQVIRRLPRRGIKWLIDWRKFIYEIRDQLNTNSCWAFTVLRAIETLGCIKGQEYRALSPQDLLDNCKTNQNFADKRGGSLQHIHRVVKFIRENGVNFEHNYRKYNGYSIPCKRRPEKELVYVGDYHTLSGDIDELHSRLGKQTVVGAVRLYPNFSNHKEGIYMGPDEEAKKKPISSYPKHGIVIVGSGTDNEGNNPFLLAVNSMGEKFGEEGYIRITRDYTTEEKLKKGEIDSEKKSKRKGKDKGIDNEEEPLLTELGYILLEGEKEEEENM